MGVAEKMESFVAMAAMDNGWALDSMCLEDFHVNLNRPRGDALLGKLSPEVTCRHHGAMTAATV